MKRFTGMAAGAVLLLSGAAAAAAQATQKPQAPMNMADHRGGLSGNVRQANGSGAATVAVKAINAENNAEFIATTDAQGAFAFAALPVGKYNISVESAGVTVYRQSGVDVAMDRTSPLNISLGAADASQLADGERQELLQRIASLEQRITDLETSAVLSEPETRVRRVEVSVDQNGTIVDDGTPGSRKEVTYERERVYRRQTINEKIEEALAGADEHKVQLGVDAALGTQFAGRTHGGNAFPNRRAYALASADLFFTAGIAQNTVFFADIVGLSGTPPEPELQPLTLVNGYTARLVRQNELNLREAWLRAEVFKQRLALTVGRLDLTNYFDQNAFANDETTQFLSDALVNNQMLGLSSNGTGVAAEFDPKSGFRFKFGFQQSNVQATNLSDSFFTLSEAGYTFTPFGLPEGTYRAWFRTDNTPEDRLGKGGGFSLDQKLTNVVGLFGRYGTQLVDLDSERDHFWSTGVSFQNGLVLNPRDAWGVGYAKMDLASGEKEDLVEGYYNFLLTDRLRLSFHLTHVLERPDSETKYGYLLPGIRFQAAF
jgi:hypothetical protein